MAEEEVEVWADAPSSWAEAKAIEARESQDRLHLTWNKIQDIYKAIKELRGLGEAERGEKLAKAEEERAALVRELFLVSSKIKTPDFSGMSEAERAEEAERLRREVLDEARRLKLEGNPSGWAKEREADIIDFDPKQRGEYYNRLSSVDLAKFDHDEESPFDPMRFTDKVYKTKRIKVCEAVNVLSVKISCSDVGFPIQVYGTVIYRDCIDRKCVYLFHRDRDDCQLISSKDESLILTGPKRGLLLLDDNYVETDLKIKDHEGQHRELSKGILTIGGIAGRSLDHCAVEKESIATRLSTVSVIYAVVNQAVEATVAVRVVQGEFYGTIIAHSTSIRMRFVLYDSNIETGDHDGRIQLMRSVMCVNIKDKLIIDARNDSDKSVRIEFTPRGNKAEKVVSTLGTTKLRVKVSWSVMDP